MNSKERVLEDCTRFCVSRNMTIGYLGKLAVGDGALEKRLSGEGDITLGKMDRLYAYMREQDPSFINPMSVKRRKP